MNQLKSLVLLAVTLFITSCSNDLKEEPISENTLRAEMERDYKLYFDGLYRVFEHHSLSEIYGEDLIKITDKSEFNQKKFDNMSTEAFEKLQTLLTKEEKMALENILSDRYAGVSENFDPKTLLSKNIYKTSEKADLCNEEACINSAELYSRCDSAGGGVSCYMYLVGVEVHCC